MSKKDHKVTGSRDEECRLPIIDDEVGEDKLVRIEPEGRNAQREGGHPEVDEVRCPQRQRHVKQHDEGSHAKVDTWPGESGEQNTEVDSRGSETTSCSDVTSASECQIAEIGRAHV